MHAFNVHVQQGRDAGRKGGREEEGGGGAGEEVRTRLKGRTQEEERKEKAHTTYLPHQDRSKWLAQRHLLLRNGGNRLLNSRRGRGSYAFLG